MIITLIACLKNFKKNFYKNNNPFLDNNLSSNNNQNNNNNFKSLVLKQAIRDKKSSMYV